MLNSVRARPKRSSLEVLTGHKVVLIFILQTILVVAAGAIYAIWEAYHVDQLETYAMPEHWNIMALMAVRAGNWL